MKALAFFQLYHIAFMTILYTPHMIITKNIMDGKRLRRILRSKDFPRDIQLYNANTRTRDFSCFPVVVVVVIALVVFYFIIIFLLLLLLCRYLFILNKRET